MNMHPLYYVKNFKEIKLLITNHAKSRLLQRYRLKLFQYEKEKRILKSNGMLITPNPTETRKLASCNWGAGELNSTFLICLGNKL